MESPRHERNAVAGGWLFSYAVSIKRVVRPHACRRSVWLVRLDSFAVGRIGRVLAGANRADWTLGSRAGWRGLYVERFCVVVAGVSRI